MKPTSHHTPIDPSSEATQLAYVEGNLSKEQESICENEWKKNTFMLKLMKDMRQDATNLQSLPDTQLPNILMPPPISKQKPIAIWLSIAAAVALAASVTIVFKKLNLTNPPEQPLAMLTDENPTVVSLDTASATPAQAPSIDSDVDGYNQLASLGLARSGRNQTVLDEIPREQANLWSVAESDGAVSPSTETIATAPEQDALEQLDVTLTRIREILENVAQDTFSNSEGNTPSPDPIPVLLEKFNVPDLHFIQAVAFQNRMQYTPWQISTDNPNLLHGNMIESLEQFSGTVVICRALDNTSRLQGTLLEKTEYWIALPEAYIYEFIVELGRSPNINIQPVNILTFGIDPELSLTELNNNIDARGMLMLYPIPGASSIDLASQENLYQTPGLNVQQEGHLPLWHPSDNIAFIPIITE